MQPPIPYIYKPFPEGWAKVTDSQLGSMSVSTVIEYNSPKYKGEIIWSFNVHYGELATRFDFNGESLQANDGHKLHLLLDIPEDFCTRIGKDGWDKFITRPYFEMWLQAP